MLEIPYSKEDLYKCGSQPIYKGRNLVEIAFPLGGIGTGSISLGGWGQLRDWEIMNRPAKGFVIPRSFFVLKVCSHEKSIVKVLQGPVEGSFIGDGHSLSEVKYPYIGWKDTGQGLPRFREVSFMGHFPIATVSLSDPDVPLKVVLDAFSPFIPLNDKDSSIPVAIFLYHVKNIGVERVSASIYGNLTNLIGYPEEGDINEVKEAPGIKGLFLSTTKFDKDSPRYGSMVLATTWSDSAVWPRWKENRSIGKFWETITFSDEFPPESGDTNTGTVAANFSLEPNEEVTIPFLISWHFPIFEHYWGKEKPRATWRNYYATIWKDAWDVALYVASNLDRLWGETKLFHDALFSSTLPIHVLDAVSSQLSILRTNTCLRLEDGTFYGFEGCSNDSGCCEGSCTHVWNYAQALPYLFPNLQRSILDAHLENSVEEDGFMHFRMPLPLGTKGKSAAITLGTKFHPATDGQMGIILQIYRQWLIEGDDEWLRRVWPAAKKLLEFAWKYWDADRDGVMEGMQHNTYDIEFYGPNTMTGSLYLAALRAMEEMARYLGEYDKAQEHRELFEKGSKWYDENLFNGEYYEQKVNPKAHEIWPEHIRQLALRHGKDDKFKDWPKWQFGKGCLSDQLIGQWYSHMLGLGYLFDSKNVRKTLESIFKYNWKSTLWDHPCLFRIYALQDEAGLIICTWPKGERPGHAFYFADEVWCGIEYQVAAHMIYEGMIDEGLAIVMGTRRRHRGDRRNPWDEFECGHHYARSMASYALLLALSGFQYSAPEKRLRFSPKIFQENFRTFFSTASGWGVYAQKIRRDGGDFSINLKYGSLTLNKLELPSINVEEPKGTVTLNDEKVEAKIEREKDSIVVTFKSLEINRGQTLRISISSK